MSTLTKGGVRDEEATELAGFGGVGPNGGLWVEDRDSADPTPSIPVPIFVTIIDPATTRAITLCLPFTKSLTIAHTGTVSIADGDAFPDPAEPVPHVEPEPVQAGETGEPNLRDV